MKRLFLFLFAAILGITQVWGAWTITMQTDGHGTVKMGYNGSGSTINIVDDYGAGGSTNAYASSGAWVKIIATPTSGYEFDYWTKDGVKQSWTATYTTDKLSAVAVTFKAFFKEKKGFDVTIQNDGNGTATADGKTSLSGVTSISNLVATPSTGYHFDHWTLNGTSQSWTQTQTNVTISAESTIKAFFAINQYTISASVDGSCTGMGRVDGGSTYNHGIQVTLTATAESGYHFEKWSDNATSNPYKFTATANKTVTAYFAPNATTYNITATKNIEDAGTATVENGTGVAAGTIATLTATVNSGYRFVKWTSNAVDYTANPLNVEVSTNAEYQAIFEELALREDVIYQDLARNGHDNDFTFGNTNYHTLTIIGNGKNTYKCLPGQQVKITVANEADWAFQKWSDENTDNPRTFTVSADATVRAIFVSSPGSPSSDPVAPTPSCDKIYQDNNSNGTTKSYATPASYSADYVDLGLSVLWGTSNVTNGGQGFFSWGDSNDQKEEYTTGTWSGESKDIVNTIKGGDWRMPTRAEFDELFANCTWSKSGTNYVGTSKTNSYATITLQARGYKYNKITSSTDWLYYWTADNSNATEAYPVKTHDFPPTRPNNDDSKYLGMSVRGVYPAPTTRYTLTVKSQNGTTVGAKVNRFVVDANGTVTVYAQPKADGSRFVRWSDGNTENPRTFTVTANAEITAEFIPYKGTTVKAGDWNIADTWTNAIMPSKVGDVTLGHAVTIGDAVDNVYVFQALANANNVTADAALTVKEGAYLTIVNDLTVNNTVTLKSGAHIQLGALTVNDGGNLVVEDGADVTLPATITIYNGGTITATNITATTLNYNGGTLVGNVEVGTLVNGTTLTIDNDFAWNITSAITNKGTLTIDDNVKFAVPALTAAEGVTIVKPTAVLKVTSAIQSEDAARLRLQSSAESNAILVLPTSGIVQPYATVELYTFAKNKSQWQHFGIPTIGQPTITKSEDAGTWLNKWDAQAQADDNMGNWVAMSSVEELNTPFAGYNLTNNATEAGVVYSFAGQLVGNAERNKLSFAELGWKPYANSYTAPISVAEVLGTLPTAAEATLWLYDPVGGSYKIATLSSLTFSEILPMQAFFIKANEAGEIEQQTYGSLLVDPMSGTNAPARSNNFNEVDYTATANIIISSATMSDVVILKESEDLTAGMDRHYDASKMLMSGKMQVYAMSGTNKQTIMATNMLEGTFIGFTAGEEKEYTMTFNHVNGNEYILRDVVTGQEFQMEEGATYTFYAEPNSTDEHRFVVASSRHMPTDLTNVMENGARVTKVVENGNMFIIKDGTRYNVIGNEVK